MLTYAASKSKNAREKAPIPKSSSSFPKLAAWNKAGNMGIPSAQMEMTHATKAAGDDLRVHYNLPGTAQLKAYPYNRERDMRIVQGHGSPAPMTRGVMQLKRDVGTVRTPSAVPKAGGGVAQLCGHILNARTATSDQVKAIGLKLMFGSLSSVLSKRISLLPLSITGHTSMVDGHFDAMKRFVAENDHGFHPKGVLNSAKVGASGVMHRAFGIDPVSVPGVFRREKQGIINDPDALRVMVTVTPYIHDLFKQNIYNISKNMHGYYSFAPTVAMNPRFEGKGSDNCTTVAFREIHKFSTELTKNKDKYKISPPDLRSLLMLQDFSAQTMRYVSNRNLERNTTYGTQGRAINFVKKYLGVDKDGKLKEMYVDPDLESIRAT